MPLCRVESCFKTLYKQKNVIYYNSIVDYVESEDVYEKEEMFKSEAAVTSATLVHTLAQAFPMCFKEESDHSLFIAWH